VVKNSACTEDPTPLAIHGGQEEEPVLVADDGAAQPPPPLPRQGTARPKHAAKTYRGCKVVGSEACRDRNLRIMRRGFIRQRYGKM
jgi:hypothetical protein